MFCVYIQSLTFMTIILIIIEMFTFFWLKKLNFELFFTFCNLVISKKEIKTCDDVHNKTILLFN
jgi:hypothetical protein